MSEVDSSLIKRGYWVNHARGEILGATITINQRYSNVFIALLAILVSVAASSAWNLLLFLLHRLRADDQPKDGLFRQQQILLRTLASPSSIAAESIKLFAAWRRHGWSAIMRCLAPASFALFFAAANLAAGISSSYVVSTTNLEVLVDGTDCKLFNMSSYISTVIDNVNTSAPYLHAFNSFSDFIVPAAESYARQCYSASSVPSRCDFYVTPRIQPTPKFISCPFGDSVCADISKGEPEALSLDSGFLDSNDVFGINAPADDRVQLRRTAACAPLNVAHHTTIVPHNNSNTRHYYEKASHRKVFPFEDFWTFHYGTVHPNAGDDPTLRQDNFTDIQSMLQSNITAEYTTTSRVSSSSEEMKGWDSIYTPIHDLQQRHADMTIMVIFTNNIAYNKPVDDPIYSAHQHWQRGPNPTADSRYSSDYPAAVMGCTEQYRFCFMDSQGLRQCTPGMGASFTSFEDFLPAGIYQRQLATLRLLAKATANTGLYNAIGTTPPYLDITSLPNQGYKTDIPKDQWTRDFRKMEDLALSLVQVFVTSQATGYTGITGGDLYHVPTTEAERFVCNNQKTKKRGDFANISVFGLAFILGWSVLLLLLDFGFMRLSMTRGFFRKKLSPGIQAWIDDGVFQLQRVAYERFTEPWNRTDEEIPTPPNDERLSSLRTYGDIDKAKIVGGSSRSAGSLPQVPGAPTQSGAPVAQA